ncbi:hypothetical protein Efla_001891 [Eimeria flavescens]
MRLGFVSRLPFRTQQKWELHAEGPTDCVPLHAFFKEVDAAGFALLDFRLSRFGSLAVLSSLLSLRQPSSQVLPGKLLSLESQTRWRYSFAPSLTSCSPSVASTGCSASSSCTSATLPGLGDSESYCLSVLLAGLLLPSTLLAATCQLLDGHQCLMLSAATERTHPLLFSTGRRRLLLRISFRIPKVTSSSCLCNASVDRPYLGRLLADLRILLTESNNLYWAFSRQCFSDSSSAVAESQATSPAPPGQAKNEDVQGKVWLPLAFLLDCMQRQGYCLQELPMAFCDLYATLPYPGEEDAVLPLLGLHAWEVRLFAKSCAFLHTARLTEKRSKSDATADTNDLNSSGSNIDNSTESSSESSSDGDSACTASVPLLPVTEKAFSLPPGAAWWCSSVLETMKTIHRPIDSASGELLYMTQETMPQS